MMSSIYICLLTISIGEVFLKVFVLFLVKLFPLLMNFKSFSYIAFWKKSFIMCLLQIFSYLVSYLLILLTSFLEHNFLILMKILLLCCAHTCLILCHSMYCRPGFPRLSGKESTCNAGDERELSLIPG